jgi:hypothetical protein
MRSEVLRELIAVTPMPPEGADAETVLSAFDAMFEARQQILLRVTSKLGDTEENRALVHEIAVRDIAWEKVLGAARDVVGATRSNAGRLRSYAR